MTNSGWLDHFSVGHADVDEDHRKLIAIMERLSDSEARQDREVVESCLEGLQHYVSLHFPREEEFMRKIGWPEIEHHTALHNQFRASMRAWQCRIEEGWAPWHGGSLYIFTAEWLMRHMIDEDARLGAFARTGEVVPPHSRRPIPVPGSQRPSTIIFGRPTLKDGADGEDGA